MILDLYTFNNGFSEYPFPSKIKYVSVIAQPLANKKTTKRIHKLVRKASKSKFVKRHAYQCLLFLLISIKILFINRGVKEVVKALRKGETGFCIIAGDISPIDVITHLPIMCEDRQIPYFYVPSKHDLGAAALTKRYLHYLPIYKKFFLIYYIFIVLICI